MGLPVGGPRPIIMAINPLTHEPKIPTSELAKQLCSDRMVSHREGTNLEPPESDCPLPAQPSASRHTYLDIIVAAYLLRRPPCQIRWLADAGLIPPHALRHEGLTCWKFRLDEFLSWAAEIGLKISQEAVWSLLSIGDKTH